MDKREKKFTFDICIKANQIFLFQKEIPTTIKCKFKKKNP